MQKLKHQFSYKNQRPAKRAAICRFGAYGDMLMATSIFPWLKEQGYHLTLYTIDRGYEVVKHDPHVDEFIVMPDGLVAAEDLPEFWAYTAKKYDKFVNLSESVEGVWLAVPGRANHAWSKEMREKYLDHNYVEFQHELAGVPLPVRSRFYPTPDERAWARREREKCPGPVVMWSLQGSAVHKAWPHVHVLFARIMFAYPSATIYSVGDGMCKIQEMPWEQETRVKRKSGDWSIRHSMAFCEVADLVIGPETGLLNAASMLDTAKICLLSHSTVENLTKHWVNTISLEPEMTHCYPCHQMHYGWQYCQREKVSGAALCQYNISVPRVWSAVVQVLGPTEVETPEEITPELVIRDNKGAMARNVAIAVGA